MDSTLPALKKLRGRHFLTDLDYTREDLEDLLKLAVNLKALWKKRPLSPSSAATPSTCAPARP